MDYRIRSGDTMSRIAAKFGISLPALEAANTQIKKPAIVFPNELVHIPSPAAPADDVAPVIPKIVTYVVQAGDTMSSIAAAHHLTLAALEAANPQASNPNLIQPGQVLNLTGGSSSSAPPTTTPAPAGMPIGAVTYARFTGSGDVPTWTTQACQIMRLPQANWVRGYTVLCGRESSGQANAINNYDSNALGPIQSDGYPLHCSRGVAQCIPDTFSSYHIAKTSQDIYDPVANIAASMHYVMNRYGVAEDASNLAELVQQADPTRSPRGY
jgi:LysM repeat protein